MKSKFFGLGNLFIKDGGEDKPLPEGPVDFEDAIAATKFGKFNIMLVAFACLSAHAFIFDTTVPPYIIPSAECDLQISLLDKGILNGISHAGMICSAPIVGYLADTIGRQKILFWGLFVDAICNISATFSHSFMLSLFLKFTAGFFVGGTNTVVISMIAEFHSAKIRPSLVMLAGLWFSLAMLVVPLMALLFLVNPFNTSFGENYEFHSWQIFWGVMSIPATLGAMLAFFIPESPRFLISRNRMAEALVVLRKVYSINTGLPPDTYPVKELKLIHNLEKDAKTPLEENEVKGEVVMDTVIQEVGGVREESTWAAVKGGLRQLRPLLRPPHLPNVLIMFMVHFGGVMGCNSLRLWLPQLFKMMSDYEAAGTDGSLCDMISFGNQTIAQRPWPEDGICEPIRVKPDTYINSVIVASVQVALCAVASIFINTIGKRRLLVSALMCGGICTISLYWCTSTVQATALASITVAFTAICMNAVLSIAVDLFPTALRAMAVSLIMMLGRIGSITGSVAFPALLATGCLTPFLTLGLILIGGGLVALFIPAPTKHAT